MAALSKAAGLDEKHIPREIRTVSECFLKSLVEIEALPGRIQRGADTRLRFRQRDGR